MLKRIIIPVLLASLLFCSCSFSQRKTEPAPTYDPNANSSNSIKIDKSSRADEITPSKYYTKADLSFGYNSLSTDDERRLYDAIIAHSTDFSDELDEDSGDGSYYMQPFTLAACPLEDRSVARVRSAVFRDHPEFFWLSSRYYFVKRGVDLEIRLKTELTEKQYKKRLKQLNAVINSIISALKPGMSEFEREIYLHDYLVKNCKYKKNADETVSENPYTVYGCLVEQKAVCEGYTSAFQLLLSYAGIQSVSIDGEPVDDSDASHTWNAVKIKNNWYYTDVTWDDTKSYSMYDYFNINEEILKKTHIIAPMYAEVSDEDFYDDNGYSSCFNIFVPECNTLKYNYYYRTACHLNSLSDNNIAQKLADAAENRDVYFNIYVNPKSLGFDSVYSTLFSEDFKFGEYLRQANSILGSDVLKLSTTSMKKPNLNVINIELEYS